MTSPRVRVVVIAAAALLGAVLTAFAVGGSSSSGEPVETTDRSPSSVEPDPSSVEPVESPGPFEDKARDPRLPSAPLSTFSADLDDNRPTRSTPPTAVAISVLDLDLPIRARGVDKAGAMALPETVNELSWYQFGSAPSDSGATVIAGHVDTKTEGIGPLSRLERLKEGDRITLTVGQKEIAYRVDEVRQVSKSLLDLDALFTRTGPPRLHLVTCGGTYDPDRGGYQANLVVVAQPVN